MSRSPVRGRGRGAAGMRAAGGRSYLTGRTPGFRKHGPEVGNTQIYSRFVNFFANSMIFYCSVILTYVPAVLLAVNGIFYCLIVEFFFYILKFTFC